ncbi:MAG: YggS family pyridoxal phosphate-dependent enzyme [Spirochaetales bacterium]|nr:YggS family pyridoxal phosphate-dependent enzyme [Spirochaetales bacterium]
MGIIENYKRLRDEIDNNVTIVLAAKTATREEILEAVSAGVTDIGQNYVQEAQSLYSQLGEEAKGITWHMIGALQTNKINKALSIFDVIQTVDSIETANAINKRVKAAGKEHVSVYIEINIGSEFTKFGVKPEYCIIEDLVRAISNLPYLRLDGLMTMGPRSGDPEAIRPYFRKAKEIMERIRLLGLPRVSMKTLSMGMSNSYKIAIEEGSTMIRLGTVILGARKCVSAQDNDDGN